MEDYTNRFSRTYSYQSIPKGKPIDIINHENQLFPYCLVWTPLPFISGLCPFIGHAGIATSKGIIHDFPGSFFVGINNFSYGKPTKYVSLSHSSITNDQWDEAITNGDKMFYTREHLFFGFNCHSYCAYILNQLNYNGRNDYTTLDVLFMIMQNGKYLSFFHFIKTYIKFGLLVLYFIFFIKII